MTPWANGFMKTEVDAFAELLYVDALRGDDATGICMVTKDNDVTVLKEATESADFLRDVSAISVLVEAAKDGRILMGHNRKKTVGKSSDENAHPYVVNNSVYFHNGTLNTHKHLADVEVDSHALAIHLEKVGDTASAIATALEKVKGAYALTWYNQSLEQLHILRNKERPLFIANLKNGGIVWASEAWMLYGICARNHLAIDKVEPVKEDTLYTVKVDYGKIKITEEECLPKKSLPPPTTAATGTGGVTSGVPSTVTAKKGGMTRNSFRKTFRELQGGYQTFWCDEFLPSPSGGFTIFGSHEDFPGLIFRARVSGKTEDWMNKEMKDQLCHGKVSYGEYDRKTQLGMVEIHDVKLTKRVQYENLTTVH